MISRLRSETVTLTYGDDSVVHDLSLDIMEGTVTSIIGPNACGKSTLLRTCARLLPRQGGDIRLGERQVHQGSHRVLARELALLAQGPIPPAGFLVEDLVAAGRTPHQSFWHQWRATDETAVEGALTRCDLHEFRYREVATLSGGQRQRAWMAMALAQDTPVLLLDEPTTFLDIAAQIDLLDLVRLLNVEQGRTVVMILHDLNLAARYSDHLVAMKDGEIITVGPPSEVITQSLLREVFSIEASIVADPRTGTPLVMPSATLTTATPDHAIVAAVAQDLRHLSEAVSH